MGVEEEKRRAKAAEDESCTFVKAGKKLANGCHAWRFLYRTQEEQAKSDLLEVDLKHANVGAHYRPQVTMASRWPQTLAGEEPHPSLHLLPWNPWET